MNTQLQEKQPWWISLELVGIKQLQNTKLHWRHMRVMGSQITGISGLFVQQPLPANSKPPNDLPFMRRNQRWPVDSPSQRDSNAENVYMSWCHNELDRILSVFLLVSLMSALTKIFILLLWRKYTRCQHKKRLLYSLCRCFEAADNSRSSLKCKPVVQRHTDMAGLVS